MKPESREAPPQEYGDEQFKGDLLEQLRTEKAVGMHEYNALLEARDNILETGAQRVRFERDKNGEEGAAAEIKRCTHELIDIELKMEELLRKKTAMERTDNKLTGIDFGRPRL